MGTRADFYVGKGKKAEWLGSIAWDGYPDGNPCEIVKLTSEAEYRTQVAALIKEENGTTPEMGWPWPWEDSCTTDYAYTFDKGMVWGACFGHGWWEAERPPDDKFKQRKLRGFPKMKTDRAAPPGSARSGVISFTIGK